VNNIKKIILGVIIVMIFGVIVVFVYGKIFRQNNFYDGRLSIQNIDSNQHESESRDEEKNSLLPAADKINNSQKKNVINHKLGSEDDNFPEDASSEALFDILENSYLDIGISDCENSCSDFDKTEDIIYCKECCNLNNAKINTKKCDDLEYLDRDYCFKQKAFSEKDILICEAIADENIETACMNQK
jgi:hypothetical protein